MCFPEAPVFFFPLARPFPDSLKWLPYSSVCCGSFFFLAQHHHLLYTFAIIICIESSPVENMSLRQFQEIEELVVILGRNNKNQVPPPEKNVETIKDLYAALTQVQDVLQLMQGADGKMRK